MEIREAEVQSKKEHDYRVNVWGSFQYKIWNRTGGNGIMVLLVTAYDPSGKLILSFDQVYGPKVPGRCPRNGDRGRAKFQIKLPQEKGPYRIVAYGAAAYDKEDALNKLRKGGLGYPIETIGTVDVH